MGGSWSFPTPTFLSSSEKINLTLPFFKITLTLESQSPTAVANRRTQPKTQSPTAQVLQF